MKRVFLIVLDSLGIGALPDAHLYSDAGTNTIKSISKSNKFLIPTLKKLGIGNIDGLDFLGKSTSPLASFGKSEEKSSGKDTTTGHWEIAGLISKKPFPVFPDGFPKEIIDKFSLATGKGVLCNKPYSGTQVISDFGKEHLESGRLIVYTSADSVFQIAAHEDIVPREKLYEYCRKAREILKGDFGVGRVIARPFNGTFPDFQRTDGRHDFSLEPHGTTLLDIIKENGKEVLSVGKISDIFAGRGITKSFPTANNTEGCEKTISLLKKDFNGLCFVNLVDFDMRYGHRRDVDGYAAALSAFDSYLSKMLDMLRDGDMLIITADHGCDPMHSGTDHTREYVPILVYGNNLKSVNLGTRTTFADISATICRALSVDKTDNGTSFLEVLM